MFSPMVVHLLAVPRARRAGAIAVAAVALALASAASAHAGKTFPPRKGEIYAGVSDMGSKSDYFDFTKAVGRHVPVMQAFERWGEWPKGAFRRFERTETRAMLSISTSPCYLCEELISPQQIRRGRGDRYLLRLNRGISAWDEPTYIRLLPEMNGHWNPYAAFDADGSSRGFDHSTKQFRKGWKRTVLIVRGGKRRRINRKLRRMRMPRIKRGRGGVPRRLPRAPVSFLWVPQTHGSPRIHANRPRAYWPGRRYVDWVGADIYAKFPNFAGLKRFYRNFRRKPFVIGEWGFWDRDDPRFVRRLHRWVERRKRAKMMVYYKGFGENNPFFASRYPDSLKALSRIIDRPRYPRYAPRSRRGRGISGGIGPR